MGPFSFSKGEGGLAVDATVSVVSSVVILLSVLGVFSLDMVKMIMDWKKQGRVQRCFKSSKEKTTNNDVATNVNEAQLCRITVTSSK